MTPTELMIARVEYRKANIRAFIVWCAANGLDAGDECQAAGRKYRRLTILETYLEERSYR